jgi:hypothetical protein
VELYVRGKREKRRMKQRTSVEPADSGGAATAGGAPVLVALGAAAPLAAGQNCPSRGEKEAYHRGIGGNGSRDGGACEGND